MDKGFTMVCASTVKSDLYHFRALGTEREQNINCKIICLPCCPLLNGAHVFTSGNLAFTFRVFITL